MVRLSTVDCFEWAQLFGQAQHLGRVVWSVKLIKELIAGYLLPVGICPVSVCADRGRSVPVTGAGADRNRGEIARNAVIQLHKSNKLSPKIQIDRSKKYLILLKFEL